jgi:glycosyltransferase involved in cell wall biosynthesis
MTNIVVILDAWEPIIGGGQKLFLNLINGLVNRHRCQITLITRALKDDKNKSFTNNQTLLNGQFNIIRLGPSTHFHNPFARFWFTFQSVIVALRHKPDLFLASSFLPGISLQLIKLINHAPNTLVAIGFGAKSRFLKLLEKIITQVFKYDLLITDDYVFYQKIKRQRNTKFIVNGVDVPNKSTVNKYPNFTYLFVGRNEPRKGIPILKESFRAVNKLYPYTQLKLFGPGHNPVSTIKLHQELYKAHCLVLPSLKEGHPLILFEAFSHKLPVIATKVGSVPQFVTKDTGYLVNPGDTKDLIVAMKLAYKNPSLPILGQNGYQLVSGHYTWAKTVDNYYQALSSLLQ